MRHIVRWLPAFLAFVGTASGTTYLLHQLHQQTRRADAFQDALNARIWERRAKCRTEGARATEMLRALSADAMAAEHQAAATRRILEGNDYEE